MQLAWCRRARAAKDGREAVAVGARKMLYRSTTMLDLVFVVVTLVFFAVSILYVRACDRL